MTDRRPAKPVRASAEETVEGVFPNDLNPLGRMGGWRVMEATDKLGGIIARKHAELPCVTKKYETEFLGTARMGEFLRYRGRLAHVWSSSCMIYVTVLSEAPGKRKPAIVGATWLLFVALDENEQPLPIPYRLLARGTLQQRLREAAERKKQRWLEESPELRELLKMEYPELSIP